MINEYDKVRIKQIGILGEVVDIYTVGGITYYTVESEKRGTPGGFGEDDDYKLYECLAEELELI